MEEGSNVKPSRLTSGWIWGSKRSTDASTRNTNSWETWPSSTPGSRRTQARLETPTLEMLECFFFWFLLVSVLGFNDDQWCVARDGEKNADIRTGAHWGGLQGSRCGFASVPWMQWTMAVAWKMIDARNSRVLSETFSRGSHDRNVRRFYAFVYRLMTFFPKGFGRQASLKRAGGYMERFCAERISTQRIERGDQRKNKSWHSWQDPWFRKLISKTVWIEPIV